MALVELKDAGVETGPGRRFGNIDLVLEPGAALAIVGRTGSGKSLLARALAGQGRFLGEATIAAKVALLDASSDASTLAAEIERGATLIVADEPGEAHAPTIQRELLTALQLARRDRGIGLLILTSDYRLPLSMGLDTAILADGKLVERGAPDDLVIHPRHEATREHALAVRPRTRTMARPPVGVTLLEFEGVTKHLADPHDRPWAKRTPRVALQRIDLVIRRGEAIGLLGPAGSGKSLLLRLAAGIGRTTAGGFAYEQQRYRGSDMPREVRARIAVLLPDPHAAFNPDLPVGLTLTEPLRVEEQLLIDEQAEGLVEAVRVVGLSPDVLDRLPATFTPFDLQRLALARALVGRPTLLMLDDPTARLDPVGAAHFIQLFNRVRSDHGLTIFWTSRSFDILRQVADRIAVLDGGTIIELGRPGELFASSTHPATRALLVQRYPEPPPPMPPLVEPVVEARPDEPTPLPESEPEVETVVSDDEPFAEPEAPEPEPETPPEPVIASADDHTDESTEGRQAELVPDGSGDGAGSIDTADSDGDGDDNRALRHVEGA